MIFRFGFFILVPNSHLASECVLFVIDFSIERLLLCKLSASLKQIHLKIEFNCDYIGNKRVEKICDFSFLGLFRKRISFKGTR